MEIVTKKEKGAVVVLLNGKLDAGSSPELEKEIDKLLTEGEKHLILDLAELGYISSAGLRVILAGSKKLKNNQGTLYVSSLGSMVREVFEVSGFSSIIPIFPSSDEALKKLG
ncbi:MAG: anti-anti-sigma factor [Deltaproteobacteria bacterium HGW-Deltaproteobacteria-15]|jgi:anti-anti-sigma factor|nr:MAG: anti-anti-sigma factor [Deltaproteobacteria bacterium HGW-Deltaproteobacteria-15]